MNLGDIKNPASSKEDRDIWFRLLLFFIIDRNLIEEGFKKKLTSMKLK